MTSANIQPLDSGEAPKASNDNKTSYFVGVFGAIIILLLIISIMTPILATIRGYYKKIDALVDPDMHIYDLPDIRPSLPPRQRKLELADELLHTVDRKQSRDNPLKLEDSSRMDINCDNGFK